MYVYIYIYIHITITINIIEQCYHDYSYYYYYYYHYYHHHYYRGGGQPTRPLRPPGGSVGRPKLLMSCDIYTHTPARKSSTNLQLYYYVVQIYYTNWLGRGHGYEWHSRVKQQLRARPRQRRRDCGATLPAGPARATR